VNGPGGKTPDGVRRIRSRGTIGLVALTAAVAATAAYAATQSGVGVIGPSTGIQPSGRDLHPAGHLTPLGNLPTGGALTPNGRFLWALSTGRGLNDVRIVQVASGSCGKGKKKHGRKSAAEAKGKGSKKCNRREGRKVGTVVQTIPFPGLSGGIAMSPDGRTAYVSGVADSSHTGEKVDPSTPGLQGDVIHVLRYDPKTGLATRAGIIPVPPPGDATPYQDFPPNTTARLSWPRDIAVSPNGRTLLVALNLADQAALIDTVSGSVRYVPVGHYPYGAGITTNGRYGLVSSETEGTVYVIDLAAGKVLKTIQVAPPLSHPESIAVDPKAPLAFVGNANQDTITAIDTKSLTVARTLSVERPQGNGTSPTYVSVTPDGCDLLSADSGEDAVAVFALSDGRNCSQGGKLQGKKKGRKKGGKSISDVELAAKHTSKKSQRRVRPFQLIGRIPTGSYPTMAAATPKRHQLVWVSARGLGVGPNPNGPNPFTGDDTYLDQYLPSIVDGDSGVLTYPSDQKIRKLTPVSDRQIVPENSQSPPANTPIKANGPIKHVFYIVRENRTYDQVLGDDSRGDGDPALSLFGPTITPNLHALVQRFPLLDHVYANSEASIDGHYWTAAGAVSDYVIKNWHQNYAGRNRPYDFGSYEVSAPPKGYIFQRMLESGVSFYNYGEALAGISPFPDKDRTPEQTAENAQVLSLTHTDVQVVGGCYDSDISIFDHPAIGPKTGDVYDSSLPPGAKAGDASRFSCFNTRFQSQLATDSVPTFNYISLPLDHTEGLAPGKRTPNADIADNDWALGQIVDAISHSSIWNSSLILVVEDDSQNGADHVDAHRIPALVISPYTQQGAVVHDRYDQISFLRTLEIISGLPAVNLGEALGVPLYDALTPNPGNSAPYDAITPSVNMTGVNPATAENIAASRGQPLDATDQVPQQVLDAMLWHYRHGFGSQPPPPGPNASPQDSKRVDGDSVDVNELARELRHLSTNPDEK
jgi:DNA-binding beta-propeller fold protein YncE